ncbi:uncharacterized protein LOC133394022 [Anopheles gambiae]|uniref:uncharacterized protein LOC133394022 n=1 Tax=Anopheles gambiae TaxID=7165 RepID=UPI002AC9E319|nr:uncharacterized protein LOC133394022 [Anopheles gambiae]
MAISISLFGKLLGRRRFMEIVLELIMMCLAGPSRAYGGTFENRIITLFCLMGIVLVSSYQSLVISFMSFVRYGPEINTLEEIYERSVVESGIYEYYYNNKTRPSMQFEQMKFIDQLVNIEDLLLLWIAYIGGMLLSILCFVMESIVHKENKGHLTQR